MHDPCDCKSPEEHEGYLEGTLLGAEQEVADLRAQLHRAQVVEAENARLRAVVDLARDVADDIDRASGQGRVIGTPVSVRELHEALTRLSQAPTDDRIDSQVAELIAHGRLVEKLETENTRLLAVVTDLQRKLADARDERDIAWGAIERLQVAHERLNTGDDQCEEEAFISARDDAIQRLLLLDREDLWATGDRTIDELIDKSSLGTPGATALRDRTPGEVARVIVLASEYLARAERAEAESARLREATNE